MSQIKVHQGWYIGFLVAWGLIGAIAAPQATAQIAPDSTLGNEGSRVIRNVTIRGGNADRIDGGAARGSNLFHSFLNFNVNQGQRVYFANPAGVQNILTRVTGNTASDIRGTLGVDGGANLFLLNPNGIIFGPNAQLDVSGSFTASTANSFTFPGGSEFSAANPGDSSLLSVAVPLGVQYGAVPPGAIANAGNLTVGQNLTLSGSSVTSSGQLAAPAGQLLVEGVAGDVQVGQAIAQTATLTASNNLILQDSQLQTAGDLNLLAGNRVQVRDSVANPFVTYAGGNLTVQGNQAVDIFALNHPSSGLVSGGDMVLRSANTVGGDAHYWAGGNFRIEHLDGNLGDLYSPYDPIIRSLGDVSFDSYIGNSLHVLAAGNINVPNFIQILSQASPGEEAINDPRFKLSNNDSFPINGLTEPTLDIRAGVNPAVIGNEQRPATGDFFPSLILTSPPPRVGSANIDVGTIILGTVASADLPSGFLQGRILLTNQYEPDTNNLVPGNIRIFDTQVNLPNNPDLNGVAIRAETPNGGGIIAIDSRGGINIRGRINANAVGNLSNGGNVTLLANEDITFREGDISEASQPPVRLGGINSAGASGGNITLMSRTGDTLLGDRKLDRFQDIEISSRNIGNGRGGDININTRDLVVRGGTRIFARNNGGEGNAGNITIVATGAVTISGTTANTTGTVVTDVAAGGIGNGGALNITARSININSNAIVAASILTGRGPTRIINGQPTITPAQAGNVTIRATGTGLQEGVFVDNSVIFSEVAFGSIGNGGTIDIHAARVVLANGAAVATNVRSTSTGDGGNIIVTTGSLTATDGSQLFASSSGKGNAGFIEVTADEMVSFNGQGDNFVRNRLLGESGVSNSGIFSSAEATAVGNAGGIRIITGNGGDVELRGGSRLEAEAANGGSAGTLSIDNVDELTLRGGASITVRAQDANGSVGTAGLLSIDARHVRLNNASITATTQAGSGGAISLQNLDWLRLIANSEISASTRTGRAGNVAIDANNSVEVRGAGSRIAVEATENGGSAGNVSLRGLNTLTVNRGGEITASTSTGRAGNVEVNADDSVEIRGNGRLAVEATRGRAGNLTINTGQLHINDGKVTASTSTGRAGNVEVNADDSVEISGDGRLAVEATRGRGRAGNLTVNTGQLHINDGKVTASTRRGRAGNVIVDANESVEISGERSRLAVEATGAGRAGNLTITTADLSIRDGAEATVSSRGEAGNLTVNADSIELDNGSLTAIARSGREGNIDINISGTLFQIYNRSTVTAGAENQGNGGSVDIRAEHGFVLANPYGNSDILANANAGRGGDINITTNAIFGLEERDPTTDLSDINAASQFNSSGSITLNTLNVDPTRGLGELPVDIVNTAELVADGCVGRNRSGVTDQGEFTQTGRGGLSANPSAPLTNEATIDRLATLDPSATPSSSASIPNAPIVEALIVEAQGLALNPQGKVSLVSNSFSSTPSPSVEQPATCVTP